MKDFKIPYSEILFKFIISISSLLFKFFILKFDIIIVLNPEILILVILFFIKDTGLISPLNPISPIKSYIFW